MTSLTSTGGGLDGATENAGPENARPENDGPGHFEAHMVCIYAFLMFLAFLMFVTFSTS